MPLFRSGMPGLFLVLTGLTTVASGAVIPYNSAEWEEQWPTWSTSGAVIPRTGTYLGSVRYNRASTGGTAQQTDVTLTVAGVIEARDRFLSSAGSVRATFGAPFRATAGDLVTVEGIQASGAAVDWTANQNCLRIVRLGPDRWT